jgi:hypothetical protein
VRITENFEIKYAFGTSTSLYVKNKTATANEYVLEYSITQAFSENINPQSAFYLREMTILNYQRDNKV